MSVMCTENESRFTEEEETAQVKGTPLARPLAPPTDFTN